jgi:hypothetical protein
MISVNDGNAFPCWTNTLTWGTLGVSIADNSYVFLGVVEISLEKWMGYPLVIKRVQLENPQLSSKILTVNLSKPPPTGNPGFAGRVQPIQTSRRHFNWDDRSRLKNTHICVINILDCLRIGYYLPSGLSFYQHLRRKETILFLRTQNIFKHTYISDEASSCQ